jgi:cohesin loading factor subunit SCC2
MIPKYQLQDLCSEAAKLKTLGAMESVPPDRLVRLLNILEKNIRDGTRVSPIADPVSVLAWSVILYGLIITSVEVKCH